MYESLQQTYGGAVSQATRNRVLRNTYWLLALSLVPTVLGAWIGVQTKLMEGMPFVISTLIFLGGAFGFMFAIEKTKESSTGVFVLLAFTFFMGVMLSGLIGSVLKFKNGPDLIMLAFGSTAAIFATMATIATTTKRDLSGMGKMLTVGVIMLFVAALANIFLKSDVLGMTLCVLSTLIFSAYMLYDVKRIVDGGETNYITATLAIYLDIYNVFQSLLALLGIFGGERD